LVPWRHVEALGRGGYWRVGRGDPQLLLPRCFPAGWIRIRFAVESAVAAHLEIYADFGQGFTPQTRIERTAVSRAVERDCFIHLDRPVQALRIDLVDGRDHFRLHRLRVEATPALLALAKAVAGKLSLLRKYGDTRRAFRRGLGLLLRGRIGALGRGLFKGLDGPSFEPPPTYDAAGAYDEWRRRRRR
jgi:hypothetical protein